MNRSSFPRPLYGSPLLALCLLAFPAWSSFNPTDLSLEELLQVQITSLGKKTQRLADTAAAVHVITQEDIRRSGAASLPEALRLAPGVDAAHLGGQRWSVSIRGFSGRWANKLLVLVDGRSIYTPLYAGTEWEQENIPLGDIERIEVIRGPAAATWGANAVSGVINILTRHAADTPGTRLDLNLGNVEQAGLHLRHGVELAPDTHARLSITADRRDHDRLASGAEANSATWRQRISTRLDKEDGARQYLFTGDVYGVRQLNTLLPGNPFNPPSYTNPTDMTSYSGGGVLLARRSERLQGGDSVLQGVLEHVYNSNTLGWTMRRNTLDLDWHRRSPLGQESDFTWGLGYRVAQDVMSPATLTTGYTPLESRFSTASLYAQSETPFDDQRWLLSLGARLEHATHTHWSFQPNARLLWHASPESSAWGALARAVRTPSRTERDATFNYLRAQSLPANTPPYGNPAAGVVVDALAGNPDLQPETLDALELGYRRQWSPRLSFDAAAFLHRHDDLRAAVFDSLTNAGPFYVANNVIRNAVSARVAGLELALDWKVREDWDLEVAYSHARLSLDRSDLDRVEELQGMLPRHIVSLRSAHNLGKNLKLDLWVRHTSQRRADYLTYRAVPASTDLDLRLAWSPRPGLELSLTGRNLLDRQHLEYVQEIFATVPHELARSVILGLRWDM